MSELFKHLKTMEEKYAAFTYFVATDYCEMSGTQIIAQRNYYRKLAQELVAEQNEIDNV